MVVVAELEADNRVADILRSPGGEEKVCVTELRQVHRAITPAIRVVGLGTVVAVAQVVNHDPVSANLSPGGPIGVGLPVPFIRGPQAEPPRQHNAEACETQHCSPRSFDHQQDRENSEDVDRGHRNAQDCNPNINVESRHSPQNKQRENEPHDCAS